ncbi:MAG: acyl-CoA desaturase [Alphaproteobacteria bacterium]|nr:acyl-CoA desaturase [Alphaproteobacteria bacterium]MBV9692395.1 acyl-CoA desaturase [Alphaproteobacteria bacterium]
MSTPAAQYVSECSLNAPRIRFAERDSHGFRRVLNARVDAYFALTGKSRLAGRAFYVQAAVLVAVMIGSYVALLAIVFGGWGAFAIALLYGLAVLQLAMNVAHDGAHLAITGYRRVDTTVQRVLMAILGVDGYLWRMRHDGSHHVFPNVNGSDIDIDENPVLRLSPNHPWRPRHRYQHLYAPFAYMLTLWDSVLIGDLKYLLKKDLANMRGIVHPPREYAAFFLLKLFYLVVSIVLPLVFIRLPWWQILLGYAAVNALVSLVFVVLLAGTHFSTEASFPLADAEGRLPTSWAAHALETALNWAPESRIAFYLTGGGNCHAAHHLFPRVSHSHYRALSRIIEDTAREHGLTFHRASFPGMIASHFAHLRRLGRDGAPPRDAGVPRWFAHLFVRAWNAYPPTPRLFFALYRYFACY